MQWRRDTVQISCIVSREAGDGRGLSKFALLGTGYAYGLCCRRAEIQIVDPPSPPKRQQWKRVVETLTNNLQIVQPKSEPSVAL